MPRPLKPYKVDTVQTQAASADVFFDRDKKLFFVTFGVERVESTDLVECMKLGRELLTTQLVLEWEGVIEVEVKSDYFNDDKDHVSEKSLGLGFAFKRYERAPDPKQFKTNEMTYRGKREGTHWMKRDHSAEHEAHLLAPDHGKSLFDKDGVCHQCRRRETNADVTKFTLYGPHAFGPTADGDHLLPYSDEAWRALCAIRDAMVTAKAKLEELVGSADFARRLRLVAARGEGFLLGSAPAPMGKRGKR